MSRDVVVDATKANKLASGADDDDVLARDRMRCAQRPSRLVVGVERFAVAVGVGLVGSAVVDAVVGVALAVAVKVAERRVVGQRRTENDGAARGRATRTAAARRRAQHNADAPRADELRQLNAAARQHDDVATGDAAGALVDADRQLDAGADAAWRATRSARAKQHATIDARDALVADDGREREINVVGARQRGAKRKVVLDHAHDAALAHDGRARLRASRGELRDAAPTRAHDQFGVGDAQIAAVDVFEQRDRDCVVEPQRVAAKQLGAQPQLLADDDRGARSAARRLGALSARRCCRRRCRRVVVIDVVVVIVVIVVGVVDRDAVGRVDDDSVVGLCSLRKWPDISSADATRCVDRTSTTAAPRRTRPRGGGSAATRATKRPPTARNGTRTVPAGSRRALSTCCRFVASVTSSSLRRTNERRQAARRAPTAERPADGERAPGRRAADLGDDELGDGVGVGGELHDGAARVDKARQHGVHVARRPTSRDDLRARRR